VGGPCVPKRWQLARGRNTPSPSQETAVHAKIFIPKHTSPIGKKKTIKPDVQPNLGDYRLLGPAACSSVAFPFSSLKIKLLWPLLLEFHVWLLSKPGRQTLTTWELSTSSWWPWRDTSSSEVGTGCVKLKQTT
jgi:hypothetical protein